MGPVRHRQKRPKRPPPTHTEMGGTAQASWESTRNLGRTTFTAASRCSRRPTGSAKSHSHCARAPVETIQALASSERVYPSPFPLSGPARASPHAPQEPNRAHPTRAALTSEVDTEPAPNAWRVPGSQRPSISTEAVLEAAPA